MLKRGVHPLYRTCPSISWAPSRHWGGVYCAAHQTGAHTSRPLLVLPRSAAQSGDAPLCLASPAALVRHCSKLAVTLPAFRRRQSMHR